MKGDAPVTSTPRIVLPSVLYGFLGAIVYVALMFGLALAMLPLAFGWSAVTGPLSPWARLYVRLSDPYLIDLWLGAALAGAGAAVLALRRRMPSTRRGWAGLLTAVPVVLGGAAIGYVLGMWLGLVSNAGLMITEDTGLSRMMMQAAGGLLIGAVLTAIVLALADYRARSIVHADT